MWCSSHLHGKQFPSILNKTTYFHMHISISEFVIPLCCRYQVVLSCTCKECSNDIQFLATSPYYNPITYTSCESLRNIYFSTVAHLTVIKKISTNHITITKVMARAIAIFLAWAIVRAMQISRTILQNLDHFDYKYYLMPLLLVCLHLASK